jgi:glycosyltransferase involved in cell wall biosynthesis
MSTPAASVVITNYNYERYLRGAIDSALAQTQDDVEVIVVDDGSTDGSREIIDSYRGSVRPIFKANGGQTSAINAGAAAARGRFVVFLDADDTLLPSALERADELFRPGVSRVFWRLWEVDADGRRTGRIHPDWGEPATGDVRDITLAQGPASYVWPPQSGNAFSRDVLELACPLPELEREWGTGSTHADAFLVDLAGLIGAASEVSEPSGTYRVHAENDWATLNDVARLERNARLYDERCRRLEQHCARLGLTVDPAAWRRESWLARTVQVKRALEAAVPPGATVTLADDNAVGLAVAGDRRLVPFLDRDGDYWGSPADDAQAVRELKRVRDERGGFFGVLWPAFWWFDQYPRFASHLESEMNCLRSTEDLRLYELSQSPQA